MSSKRAARAEQLIQTMMEDMDQVPRRYQPTLFWQRCSRAILRDIHLFGIENFYAHPSAQTMYASRTDPDRAAKDLQTVFSSDTREKPRLQDYSQSLTGRPSDLFIHEGKRYSSTALSYLRGLAFLKQTARPAALSTVFEIGGGFGCLGEILTKQGVFYLNVDIPPLAAIATYYLQEALGEQAVLTYDAANRQDSLSISQLAKDFRAAVLCPWQLPKVTGAVDLAVNYVSFQEMEPDIVTSYAKEIQRLRARWVLLRNCSRGKPVAKRDAPKCDALGVEKPTTRAHYLDCFKAYQLLASDTKTFGEPLRGNASEVLIFGPHGSQPI